MPHVRAGAASIHDPGAWRAEDRLAVGEHVWVLLSGTPNEAAGQNEADVAAPIAEALARAPDPPSTDEVIARLAEMDRAVRAWELSAPAGDLFGTFLGVVALVVDEHAVRIVHVGLPRAYRLTPAGALDPIAAQRLTIDHCLAEEASGARDPGLTERERGQLPFLVTSSIGQSPIARIDTTHVPITKAARFVLTSRGAHAGLETPLGYLREVRSPLECAQRICAEARARAGERPRHASAIVVDVDPESGEGPYR